MSHAGQGVHAFLRAYYHMKSADWKQNKPFPLKAWTAAELAQLPRYYVMDLDKGISYKGSFLDDEGVPMVNLKCFSPTGGFRFDALKGYSGPTKAQHRVRPGDLVMANTDLTQAGMIVGRVAVVRRLTGRGRPECGSR